MLKIKVRISGTKYRSFYKTLTQSLSSLIIYKIYILDKQVVLLIIIVRNNNSQPPKSRSIDEINRMLASMAENKTNLVSSHPPQVDQKLLESSLFVNYNPGGRLNRRHGSMESMGSGTYSVGSTGSYTGKLIKNPSS